MDRADWQRLSLARQRESAILLDAGAYAGAYYLIGYAVECALKACIVKALPAQSMPDRKLSNAFYSHDVEQLLALTELRGDMIADPARRLNWNEAKDWNEQARYRGDIAAEDAQSLYRACTETEKGVLAWLRKSW